MASRSGKKKAAVRTRPKARAGAKKVSRSRGSERARRTDFDAALKLYEAGFKLVHSDQFSRAKSKLRELIQEFPGETELLDRANVLMQVCNMRLRLAGRGPKLESAEDYYQAGVAELNRRELETALAHLQKALKLLPKGDHIHYALAAVSALREDAQEALEHLRAAIEYRDENRFLAAHDADFEFLSENAEFIELVNSEAG